MAVLRVVLVAGYDTGHGVLADDDKGVVAPNHLLQPAPGWRRPAMQQQRGRMQRVKVDAAGAVTVPDKDLLHPGIQQTVHRGVDLAGHQFLAGVVVAAVGKGLVREGDDAGHAFHVGDHEDFHG